MEIKDISKVSKSYVFMCLQRSTYRIMTHTHRTQFCFTNTSIFYGIKKIRIKTLTRPALRTEVGEGKKKKEYLRNFSMGSSILLTSQQIKSTTKGTRQKSITKVVMQILTDMRKNIQMRNMQNFNLKFPVIIGETNVFQPFKEKSVVF